MRKCLRRAERWQAEKRRAELSTNKGNDELSLDTISREPTPEEAMLLVETLDATMRPFNDRERNIIELRLEGCSDKEIARRIERSLYTVQMVLRRAERSLRKMLTDSE